MIVSDCVLHPSSGQSAKSDGNKIWKFNLIKSYYGRIFMLYVKSRTKYHE